MKILMVNKFLYPNGGSETYIFKLGEYLISQGHEVQYFGMEHEGRCVGNAVNAYTSDMDFHGGDVLSKVTYPVKTIYSKEAREKIRLVLDDFQPDVVHLNNITYQLTPSMILEIVDWRKKTGKNCRIVFTAHDYNLVCPNHMLNNPNTGENCEKCLGGHFFNCTKGKCIHGSTAKSAVGTMEGYFWQYEGAYKYIDTVICCSRFLKEKMSTNPVFARMSVVLHNFVDQVEWKGFDEEDGGVPKKDYVLYFGRFSKEKGIDTLLNVCRELPEIHFIFAGSGPLEVKVNRVKNIKNVGFQTGEALEKLIREARFSIYPSEWYENCPFSVMESQMYGTPVLGADIGGIPELIEVGKTGELFESGNGEDLKEKILRLWNDTELTMEYAENCKDVRFDSVEEYCRKLMKIYMGDLKRKKKTARKTSGKKASRESGAAKDSSGESVEVKDAQKDGIPGNSDSANNHSVNDHTTKDPSTKDHAAKVHTIKGCTANCDSTESRKEGSCASCKAEKSTVEKAVGKAVGKAKDVIIKEDSATKKLNGTVIVTYRCNARCSMCNRYKAPSKPEEEISIETIRKLPKMYFTNITGGEPFIRTDLKDIVRELYKKSDRIVISTNGFFTDRIVDLCKEFPDIGIRISIEGLEQTNNEIRGLPNGYQRGYQTLKVLREMGMKDVGFGMTVQDKNAPDLVPLYKISDEMGMEFATASLHNSFYFVEAKNIIHDRPMVAKNFEDLVNELLKSNSPKKWFRAYFNHGLINYIYGQPRLLPCDMSFDTFFIDPYGDVMPCNGTKDKEVMGNLNTQTWEELWNSPEAEAVRKKVRHCDRQCWMIGSVSPAMHKYIWVPGLWVVRHKARQLLGFKKPYSMYENKICRDYRDGMVSKEQLDKCSTCDFNAVINDGLSAASKEQLKGKTGEEIVDADIAAQMMG